MPGVDEIDVYLINIDARTDLVRECEALLSEREKEKASGFRFDRDRSRYVIMHGVLRRVLSGYLDTSAEGIDFRENEYGKPHVPADLEFSISYSGDRGLIAVARVPIGVDMEKVDRDKVTEEMIEEVFSASERESFFDDSAPAIVDAFFRGWVRKESVIKAIGTGVSFPLRLVESRLDQQSFTAAYDGVEWWTCDLEACGPGYEAALTVARKDSLPTIRLQSLKGRL